jgi:hypothetical protein
MIDAALPKSAHEAACQVQLAYPPPLPYNTRPTPPLLIHKSIPFLSGDEIDAKSSKNLHPLSKAGGTTAARGRRLAFSMSYFICHLTGTVFVYACKCATEGSLNVD